MKWPAQGIGLCGLNMLLASTACVGTRPSPVIAPEHTPPAIAAPSAAAPAPAIEAEPSPSTPAIAEPAPQTGTTETSVANSAPPCICATPKLRAKPKQKPKVVRAEAPPQLSTSPVVEHTPAGGLIDAQVSSMNVSVISILGKRVRGANGEDLGRVVDVLADASGRVRTAIIDFGGFLGVGNHRVAVDWPLLRFNPDGSDPSLLLSLSVEKLRTAPEYKDTPRPQILMVPTAASSAPAE